MRSIHARKGIFFLLLSLCALLVFPGCEKAVEEREVKTLVVLNINDLHGQLDPFRSGKKQQGRFPGQEVGGCARLATAIKEIKDQYPGAVLTVSNGDNLMGKYFNHFDGKVTYKTLSLMGIDVATLGNHEFDRGVEVLAGALSASDFPNVVSNIKVSEEHPLKGRYVEYTVQEINGVRIGIMGLLIPSLTSMTAGIPDVTVDPDIAGIARRLSKALRTEHDADLILALTHIGLQADIALAKEVEGIDVICGGHSHDLIREGKAVVVPHGEGRPTIIVQAGSRGEYLGALKMTVVNGSITEHHWKPIRIDSTISDDQRVAFYLNTYKTALPPNSHLANLKAPLDCRGLSLRNGEAAVGNLICDALRNYFKTDVALQNGGGIRGDRIIPEGSLTTEDLSEMLPFGNDVVILRLKGSVLKETLERSVAALPELSGAFLHVSGLRYTIDPARRSQELDVNPDGTIEGIKVAGERIIGVAVEGPDEKYHSLEPDRTYSVAANSFIAEGGDGYWMLGKAESSTNAYVHVASAVRIMLEKKKEIDPTTDGRIKITN
ncbi:bifunctional metallophosphatase/5'-nucleotidase [Acidobacteriota bacterium]